MLMEKTAPSADLPMPDRVTYTFPNFELTVEGDDYWLRKDGALTRRSGDPLKVLRAILELSFLGHDPVRRQDVIGMVWPNHKDENVKHQLDVNLSTLKKKILEAPDNEIIETVRNVGFRFRAPFKRTLNLEEKRPPDDPIAAIAGRKAHVIRRSSDGKAIYDTLLAAAGGDLLPGELSSLDCFKRWSGNPNVLYRAISVIPADADASASGAMIGFCSVHPLKAEAYEWLNTGFLHYDHIDDRHIANYSELSLFDETPRAVREDSDDVCLFILDFEMIQTRSIEGSTGYLLCDVAEILRRWIIADPRITTIATLAATEAGRSLANRFGFPANSFFPIEQPPKVWQLFYLGRREFLGLAAKVLNMPDVKPLRKLPKLEYKLTDDIAHAMRKAFVTIAKSIGTPKSKRK